MGFDLFLKYICKVFEKDHGIMIAGIKEYDTGEICIVISDKRRLEEAKKLGEKFGVSVKGGI